jgi:excisionase family DNA binding protein
MITPVIGRADIGHENGSDSLFFLNRHDANFAVVKESSVSPNVRRCSTHPSSACDRLFLHDAAFSPIPLTLCPAESISDRNGRTLAMIEHNGRGNRRDGSHSVHPVESRKHRHRSPRPAVEDSKTVMRSAIPFAQRLACTVAEACEATGLGRTKLYELIGQGQLDTTTVGRRRLVMVPSLLTLLEAENK